MPDQTVQYLLEFLLRDATLVSQVGYTACQEDWPNYSLVIVPSSFSEDLNKQQVQLPTLPLQQLEGMPFLFGESKIEELPITKEQKSRGVKQPTKIVYADFIASAFFMVSRMEELLNPQRDRHGRFLGHYSLAYKAGYLYRPLVDEYGQWMVSQLQEILANGASQPATASQQNNAFRINLTHDVDVPYQYRTFRSMVGGILRKDFQNVRKYAKAPLQENPLYTFPWLIEQDQRLQQAAAQKQEGEGAGASTVQTIYFLRAPMHKNDYDRPFLNLHSKDMQTLIQELKASGALLGLHASYYAGMRPHYLRDEQQAVSEATQQVITANRHHYLTAREPLDMRYLLKAGITDDYTLGYADLPGFRLGTTRAVRFIRPDNGELTSLVLHPLMAMDGTFTQYMNIPMEEAFQLLQGLAQITLQQQGELTVLWHNSTVLPGKPLRGLYEQFIGYLVEIIESMPKK